METPDLHPVFAVGEDVKLIVSKINQALDLHKTRFWDSRRKRHQKKELVKAYLDEVREQIPRAYEMLKTEILTLRNELQRPDAYALMESVSSGAAPQPQAQLPTHEESGGVDVVRYTSSPSNSPTHTVIKSNSASLQSGRGGPVALSPSRPKYSPDQVTYQSTTPERQRRAHSLLASALTNTAVAASPPTTTARTPTTPTTTTTTTTTSTPAEAYRNFAVYTPDPVHVSPAKSSPALSASPAASPPPAAIPVLDYAATAAATNAVYTPPSRVATPQQQPQQPQQHTSPSATTTPRELARVYRQKKQLFKQLSSLQQEHEQMSAEKERLSREKEIADLTRAEMEQELRRARERMKAQRDEWWSKVFAAEERLRQVEEHRTSLDEHNRRLLQSKSIEAKQRFELEEQVVALLEKLDSAKSELTQLHELYTKAASDANRLQRALAGEQRKHHKEAQARHVAEKELSLMRELRVALEGDIVELQARIAAGQQRITDAEHERAEAVAHAREQAERAERLQAVFDSKESQIALLRSELMRESTHKQTEAKGRLQHEAEIAKMRREMERAMGMMERLRTQLVDETRQKNEEAKARFRLEIEVDSLKERLGEK